MIWAGLILSGVFFGLLVAIWIFTWLGDLRERRERDARWPEGGGYIPDTSDRKIGET